MKNHSLLSFVLACLVFLSMSAFAQTGEKKDLSAVPDGSLKIKEFLRDFDVKISKKELLGMIDTLAQSGKISKVDAEKARKEISAMSDDQFEKATKDAINKIPDDLTVEEGKDPQKVLEKVKANEKTTEQPKKK